ALALDVGNTDGCEVVLIRNLALDVVEHLTLDEDHRVIIANGALQQALGISRSGRHHDLEAGYMSVPALERLRVLCAKLQRGATGPTEDHGAPDLTVAHVPHLRRSVDDLVNGHQRKVPGHHFDDGAQTDHGSADANTGK